MAEVLDPTQFRKDAGDQYGYNGTTKLLNRMILEITGMPVGPNANQSREKAARVRSAILKLTGIDTSSKNLRPDDVARIVGMEEKIRNIVNQETSEPNEPELAEEP